LILCCLGCAIFGITEVPTDGVDFDTGDFGGESNAESISSPPAAPTGTNYAPPLGNDDSTATASASATSDPDPEKGEGTMGDSESKMQVIPEPAAATAPALDLLDDYEQGNPPKQTPSAADQGGIHELD
jgi:hypothetical protein